MKLLLDTHTFLWSLGDTSQLSTTVTELIEDPSNHLYLSMASVWELAIKASIGKLQAPTNLEEYINTQLETRDIELLPISLGHVTMVRNMPRLHGDPFDRLLIAQASLEQMPLLSRETDLFKRYGVQVIW